jgi:hypothetical protein
MKINFSISAFSISHEECHDAHYPPDATSTTAKSFKWQKAATFFEGKGQKKPRQQEATQNKPTK